MNPTFATCLLIPLLVLGGCSRKSEPGPEPGPEPVAGLGRIDVDRSRPESLRHGDGCRGTGRGTSGGDRGGGGFRFPSDAAQRG